MGADVVVSGLPFDLATTLRPGARFGPRRFERQVFSWQNCCPMPIPLTSILLTSLQLLIGAVEFVSGYPDQAVAVIEAHAKQLLAQDVTMLTFGGDHFVTTSLKAHAEKFGKLSLVHFGCPSIPRLMMASGSITGLRFSAR